MSLQDRMKSEINGLLSNEVNAWIIGSGTSLKGFDLSRLDKEFTIAINHSVEFYPKSKCLLFGDKVFLKHSNFNLHEYPGMIYATNHCKGTKTEGLKNIRYFEADRQQPNMKFEKGLFHPCSSGLLALNLAVIMKAKRIFLLGFDYYYDKGETHFYGNIYPHHLEYPEDRIFKKIQKFRFFERFKSKIINLNPDSLIPDFEKRDWRNL